MTCIDKENLLKDLITIYAPMQEQKDILVKCIKKVNEQPTADVEEVKQGQFVRNERNIPKMKEFHKKGFALSMNEKSIFYTCSECGEWISLSQKYCSECGSKMDGGEEE